MYKSCTGILPQSTEDDLYNKGVNERDPDNPVKGNIVVANAKQFDLALRRSKILHPDMDEIDVKAMVVFDFLQKSLKQPYRVRFHALLRVADLLIQFVLKIYYKINFYHFEIHLENHLEYQLEYQVDYFSLTSSLYRGVSIKVF